MKCKCGNEAHKPVVNPRAISFMDSKTRQVVHILYQGGFNQHGECWFCSTPNVGRHL
jgi:hypothetical protein